MPRSRSAKNDRPNLLLAHNRMMTSAVTHSQIAISVIILSIAFSSFAYIFLGGLNLGELTIGTLNLGPLRNIIPIFVALFFLWHAKDFAQRSLRYSKTARAIEQKLNVDKTLKKYGIHEPLSEESKKSLKRSR